ncbi:MAG: helix-hairpin-helix domain-containing protein [Clostridia bacterium]|nr:helix-hairpin-helix domain-containing protein [Clostridia bacterium]
MENLSNKQKIVLIIIGILVILFIAFYITKKTNNYNYDELEVIEEENNSIQEKEEQIIEEEIIVHITGEVENEGIIKINKNSRIADAIERAGGTTEYADLSKINLAYVIKDGQKIYIPNINDKETQETQETMEQYITEEAGDNIVIEDKKIEEKVNINTASQTELETLSGIGPSTALKIINYRQENGEFKTIEDIKNVSGIGEAKFENIKNNICIK